jgi:hypothetical protein
MRRPPPPPPRKGWCSVCTRLTPEERAEANRLHGQGWGFLRLAKRYGCSRSAMHRHFAGRHEARTVPYTYAAFAEWQKTRIGS